MSEKRFPNAEEIALLRSKGIVSVSPYVCRISASISMLLYLKSSQIFEQIETILSATILSFELIQADLAALARTFIIAVLIFIFTFVSTALLQSWFYFKPGFASPNRKSFFDILRIFSLIRLPALLFACSILLLSGLLLFVYKRFLMSELTLVTTASLPQVAGIFESGLEKLSFVIMVILLLTIVLAFVYSKVRFRFLHRVLIRPS